MFIPLWCFSEDPTQIPTPKRAPVLPQQWADSVSTSTSQCVCNRRGWALHQRATLHTFQHAPTVVARPHSQQRQGPALPASVSLVVVTQPQPETTLVHTGDTPGATGYGDKGIFHP